jgi:hypothetical protein
MDNLTELIRPSWIELLQLQSNQDFNAAAERLFGYQEGKVPHDHTEYSKRLGIDIQQYRGFYAEIGGVDTPVGPVTPATARLVIKPILAIRQTHRGNYTVQSLAAPKGFFNRDRSRAWVTTDDYEELLGDVFFREVMDETERIKQAAAAKEPSQREVYVGTDLPMSPQERAIFERIKRG